MTGKKQDQRRPLALVHLCSTFIRNEKTIHRRASAKLPSSLRLLVFRGPFCHCTTLLDDDFKFNNENNNSCCSINPIILASNLGHFSCLSLVLEKCDPVSVGLDVISLAFCYCACKSLQCLRLLFTVFEKRLSELPNEFLGNVLGCAIASNHEHNVCFLISEKKVDFFTRDFQDLFTKCRVSMISKVCDCVTDEVRQFIQEHFLAFFVFEKLIVRGDKRSVAILKFLSNRFPNAIVPIELLRLSMRSDCFSHFVILYSHTFMQLLNDLDTNDDHLVFNERQAYIFNTLSKELVEMAIHEKNIKILCWIEKYLKKMCPSFNNRRCKNVDNHCFHETNIMY